MLNYKLCRVMLAGLQSDINTVYVVRKVQGCSSSEGLGFLGHHGQQQQEGTDLCKVKVMPGAQQS